MMRGRGVRDKMSFISISIDICESTKIKQQVVKYFSEKESLSQLYYRFVQMMCLVEFQLYDNLIVAGFDLERVFVIKNIGDEIWIAVKIGDEKGIDKDLKIIVDCLIKLCSRPFPYIIDNLDIKEGNKKNIEGIKLVPKIFIDLIDKYTEITEIRESMFNSEFSRFLPPNMQKIDFNIKKKQNVLLNNLNICSTFNNITIRRFDGIGFNIDLFFRSTKFSIPGIVTIGNNLFNSNNFKDYKVVKKHCKAKELKGCEYGYDIYRVYDEKKINQDIVLVYNDSKYNGVYKETIKFLKKNKFDLKKNFPYL